MAMVGTATGGTTTAAWMDRPLGSEATFHGDGSIVMDEEGEEAFMERTGGLPEARLDVSGVTWRRKGPGSDPSCVLRACVGFLGATFALEAYAVATPVGDDDAADGEGSRMEFADDCGAKAEDMWLAHGMQGHAGTVTIAGRAYAVFMSPFCD